jgi:hypothetical protein
LRRQGAVITVSFWHSYDPGNGWLFDSEVEALPRVGELITFPLDEWDAECVVEKVTWVFGKMERRDGRGDLTADQMGDPWRARSVVEIEVRGVNTEEDAAVRRSLSSGVGVPLAEVAPQDFRPETLKARGGA